MLNSLSRNRTLPQIVPRCGCLDSLRGRLPFQGYGSTCSGRHYYLRGMDYHTIEEPGTERRRRTLCPDLPTVRFAGISSPWQGSAHERAPTPWSPALLGCGSLASCLTLALLFPCQAPIGFCLLAGPQGTSEQLRQRTSMKVPPKFSVLSFPTVLRVQTHDKCLYSGDSAKTVSEHFKPFSLTLSFHSRAPGLY